MLTRLIGRRPPLGAGALAELSAGFSGAEIEQAISSGLFEAFGTGTRLTTDVLARELRETRPLSRTMAERLDQLRTWAQDRTVPADGGSAMRAVA